jgi:streptogramin lyase
MDFQLPGNVNNALGGIATAPDGSLWFCEQDGHIGRLQY